MPFISEHPALRTHLESQVDFINEFTQKAFDTLRQVSEINLKLARQTIEGTLHAHRELIACSDPAQLVQTAMKQLQPANERLRAYQQHMMSALAGAQADFTHVAEARLPEASRSASAAADELVRHAAAAANPSKASDNGQSGGDAPPYH